MKILFYEVERQFGDRLVNPQSKTKFRKLLESIFQESEPSYYIIQNQKLIPTVKEHFTLGVKSAADLYERDVRDVRMVLVDEVLSLFAGIEKRILEGGSILLAGESGTFRRTTVNLLAFKHKLPLLIPTVLKKSTIRDFNKDLKQFIEIAAGQNKKIMVLFEDHHL